MRHTHTYVVLEVPPALYAHVREKLLAAGYQHALHDREDGEVIDMHGIALAPSTEATNEEPG